MKLIGLALLAIVSACSENKTEGQRANNAEVGEMRSDISPKLVGAAMYTDPEAFEGKIVTLCSWRPIDGQTVMVGNTGRSPNVIWLDRPTRAPSGCITSRFVRGETPPDDSNLADGPISLSGWVLNVLDPLPQS